MNGEISDEVAVVANSLKFEESKVVLTDSQLDVAQNVSINTSSSHFEKTPKILLADSQISVAANVSINTSEKAKPQGKFLPTSLLSNDFAKWLQVFFELPMEVQQFTVSLFKRSLSKESHFKNRDFESLLQQNFDVENIASSSKQFISSVKENIREDKVGKMNQNGTGRWVPSTHRVPYDPVKGVPQSYYKQMVQPKIGRGRIGRKKPHSSKMSSLSSSSASSFTVSTANSSNSLSKPPKTKRMKKRVSMDMFDSDDITRLEEVSYESFISIISFISNHVVGVCKK